MVSSFPENARSGLVGIFACFCSASGSVPTFAKHSGNFLRVFACNFFLWHGSILQGDSVSRVANLLDAVNISPAFNGFVIAGLPIDQFRNNLEARHNLKAD